MRFRNLITATVLFSVAASLTAGTVLELRTQIGGSGEEQAHRVLADAGNLRMGVAGDPETEVIYRADRDELMVIDHARQQFMVLDRATAEGLRAQIDGARAEMERALADLPPQQRAMMEQMMMGRMPDVAAQPDRFEITELGGGGPIAGIETRRMQVSRNGQPERNVWVAPWNSVGDAQSLRSSFESMSSLLQRMLDGIPGAGQFDNPYRQLEQLGGMPLRTEELGEGGVVKHRSEVIALSDSDIEPGQFEPPAGYSRQSLLQ